MRENQQNHSLNKKIEIENIIYMINFIEKTASVIGRKSLIDDIFILRSINHNSNEYVINTISKGAFQLSQIKSIKFAPNSEIETIEKNAFASSSIESFTVPPHLKKICDRAFSHCLQLKTIEIPSNSELKTIEEEAFTCSSIESFTIPSSLVELKEGWCANMSKLNKIKVCPKNPRYCCIDEKFIVGKTSIESENYDNLIFCVRNIETVTIPCFIKTIETLSFNRCRIKTVGFSLKSELQEINKFAFYDSSIKFLQIPHHLTKIGECAFSHCRQLKKVEIPNNSRLQTIQICAFSYTSIESFVIPYHIIHIGENAFGYCDKLLIIEINENIKIEIMMQMIFNSFKPVMIMIPKKENSS